MDPISFGATVGAVMELYEMGVLAKEQVGIEAPFGSAGACAAGRDTTRASASARRSARAPSACARSTAKPELSMSVKGQEFPAYDGAASRAWA